MCHNSLTFIRCRSSNREESGTVIENISESNRITLPRNFYIFMNVNQPTEI